MNFEELQVIWNSQNNEKMYVINEAALHAYIKREGKSINRTLDLYEFLLIGANLAVGILLTIDSLDNVNPSSQSILAVLYLAFAVYALIRRLVRRNAEKPFEHTILGELDRAIWRIDYLMRQGWALILWYILPLMFIFGVMSFFNTRLLWALLLIAFTTYVGYRWEMKKLELPQKHNLESLREKLTVRESQ
ncbi:MAG TPA: hypothetical protein VHP14_03315 [Anaerolineales bacterium]|nr:hypothetical protein [Anaerolineales bacterium]